MKTTTTTIRGLAIDVLVIETTHTDAVGAEIMIRERKTGTQRLVRRSRIPGAGQALVRNVQRNGIRALEAFERAA
jgi:hypothetical protein